MKSFREMLDQNKLLPESDLGLVSPGLETSDDKEPYKQDVINNYDEESQVKPKLNEASELDYEDLVEELREKTQMIKTELDRIFNRVKYRFLLNVSYDKKEANKIQDDIWKELDKAQKMISKCYNKVG